MLFLVTTDIRSRLTPLALVLSIPTKMCPADLESPPEADSLLHRFVSEHDPTEAETLLARLLSEHAEPLIRKVIASKLQRKEERQDVDDVVSEVLLQLTRRLRGLRDAKTLSITSFRAYVARTAENACHRYVRERHPVRSRLKNKLRYLLNHRPEFQTQEDKSGNVVCVLKEWDFELGLCDVARLDLSAFAASNSPIIEQSRQAGLPTAALVMTLLLWLGGPVYLDDLDTLLGQLLGTQDLALPGPSPPSGAESSLERLRDQCPGAVERLALSNYLARLWSEISCLSLRQRHALLLNLRESGQSCALSLFVETGVVSLAQIAEVLEFELDTFAALWNQLPLDDISIAARLGATRQRVINLRKSARERLERRMRLVG